MSWAEIIAYLLGGALLAAGGYIWYLRSQLEQRDGGIERLEREIKDCNRSGG